VQIAPSCALVWSAALLLFGDVIAYVLEWLWRVV
jgi:hypothetical protein